MRTVTSGVFTISYFDDEQPVFNICPIKISATINSNFTKADIDIIYDGSVITARVEARNNKAFIDISTYVQQFFNVDDFMSTISNSCGGSSNTSFLPQVSIIIYAYLGTTPTTIQLSNTYFYWAALGYNESIDKYNKYQKHFVGYDMNVSLPQLYGHVWRVNGEVVTSMSDYGMFLYYICANTDTDIIIQDFSTGLDGSITIKSENPNDTKDKLYLRWIDNSGMLRFWLFNTKNLTHKTKSEEKINSGIIIQSPELYRKVNFNVGIVGNITREDTVNIYYPLATRGERKLLSTIFDSPVVEAYNNDGSYIGSWSRCMVTSGSYKESNEHLSDFEATISLPIKPSQKI